MTTLSLASRRRASILALTLAALLPSLAAAGGTRETCPKPAPDASASSAEVPTPLTTVDLVFVTVSSKKPGLADQAPDEEWADWKLDDISGLVAERAPKVLRSSGLSGEVIVLPAPKPGDPPDFSTLDPSRPALVFAPTEFSKWRPGLLTNMAGSLAYSVRLINAAADAPQPKCRLEVFGGFGFHPVWGRMKTNRADQEWVETRINDGLVMMAKHGVIKFVGEKSDPAESIRVVVRP
jgi:hypothetical protein